MFLHWCLLVSSNCLLSKEGQCKQGILPVRQQNWRPWPSLKLGLVLLSIDFKGLSFNVRIPCILPLVNVFTSSSSEKVSTSNMPFPLSPSHFLCMLIPALCFVIRCQPGFKGDHCELECSEGFFGPQCNGKCQCLNNATCNKEDGTCDCQPGWIGVRCDNPCPAGYYGKNCQSKCRCQNGGSCDSVDGKCTCVNEWQGEICDICK